jgi:hypothetical protein
VSVASRGSNDGADDRAGLIDNSIQPGTLDARSSTGASSVRDQNVPYWGFMRSYALQPGTRLGRGVCDSGQVTAGSGPGNGREWSIPPPLATLQIYSSFGIARLGQTNSSIRFSPAFSRKTQVIDWPDCVMTVFRSSEDQHVKQRVMVAMLPCRQCLSNTKPRTDEPCCNCSKLLQQLHRLT